MDTGTNNNQLGFVNKLSKLRYTLLMVVTAYGAFMGRTTGGFDFINKSMGIVPETYAVLLIITAFIWTAKVISDRPADGVTLTPLLLYYTMASYAIIQTPGAPTGPIAAYVFIASEILQMIFLNKRGLFNATRNHYTNNHRLNGHNS